MVIISKNTVIFTATNHNLFDLPNKIMPMESILKEELKQQ
jgi:hypothetical protein